MQHTNVELRLDDHRKVSFYTGRPHVFVFCIDNDSMRSETLEKFSPETHAKCIEAINKRMVELEEEDRVKFEAIRQKNVENCVQWYKDAILEVKALVAPRFHNYIVFAKEEDVIKFANSCNYPLDKSQFMNYASFGSRLIRFTITKTFTDGSATVAIPYNFQVDFEKGRWRNTYNRKEWSTDINKLIGKLISHGEIQLEKQGTGWINGKPQRDAAEKVAAYLKTLGLEQEYAGSPNGVYRDDVGRPLVYVSVNQEVKPIAVNANIGAGRDKTISGEFLYELISLVKKFYPQKVEEAQIPGTEAA